MHSFRRGDPVVFTKTKFSTRPGPRARDVAPTEHGDVYTYNVDKYWVVLEARTDRTLLLGTRRGKRHVISATHPNLRPAHWWERLLYRRYFPKVDEIESQTVASQDSSSG